MMSVIGTCQSGWLIDHKKAIDDAYHVCREICPSKDSVKRYQRFKARDELFDLRTPFMMDSQFEKIHRMDNSQAGLCRSRKRKRKAPLNEGEIAANEYHEHVKPIIDAALQQLVAIGRRFGHFGTATLSIADNNLTARQAARSVDCALIELGEMAGRLASPSAVTEIMDGDDVLPDNLFDSLICHNMDEATRRPWLGASYLIPSRCRFLMSPLARIQPLLDEGTQYDMIVLDPPWENKSVKRKKKYATLSVSELRSLPVHRLASDHCLVAVWVTGRQSIHEAVKSDLFPSWRVKYLAKWHWLKVTTAGEPITSMDSRLKKPYETLLIGRVGSKDSVGMHCDNDERKGREDMTEDSRVIVSVPSSVHSQKPPLNEIMSGYLSERPNCLEMFARSLLPGWTSWGNEVLKLQNIEYFKQSDVTTVPCDV